MKRHIPKRKPKAPLRRKLLEMDVLFNFWCPYKPLERIQKIARLSPCRYKLKRWQKPLRFFGSSCDRFGLTETANYVGISREDGAYVYRIYKKKFDVNARLELLQIACNQVARLYHK